MNIFKYVSMLLLAISLFLGRAVFEKQYSHESIKNALATVVFKNGPLWRWLKMSLLAASRVE